MLHIESQGHRPSGFGEDLKGSLPFIHMHIDVAAILVMRPGPYEFLGSIWPCDYVVVLFFLSAVIGIVLQCSSPMSHRLR